MTSGSISSVTAETGSGMQRAMAEVFGHHGQTVPESGQYECAECGHREHFNAGDPFPPDHHPDRPWTLYLRD